MSFRQPTPRDTYDLTDRIATALEAIAAELEAMNATLWTLIAKPEEHDLGQRIAAAHAKRGAHDAAR